VPRRALAAVLLLAALQILANAVWLARDEGVQFTDAAHHYGQVIELRDALLAGPDELVALPGQDETERYGGLWYAVGAAVSLLSGPEPGRLLLGLSVLLWPALLLAAYGLGAELARAGCPAPGGSAAPEGSAAPDPEATGVLAAFLCGCIPGVFNYSRVLVLDLPLAVFVAAALALLLRARREGAGSASRRRALSWAAGLGVAGMLVKVNALAFLLGPALLLGLPALRAAWRSERRRVLTEGASAGAVGVALGLWFWLGPRGPALRETLREGTWPGALLDYAREGSLAEWPAHWIASVSGRLWEMSYYALLQTLTAPGALLAALAAGALAWAAARAPGSGEGSGLRQAAAMLGLALGLPLLLLILFLRGMYDERYLVPMLPPLAAAAAWAALGLPASAARAGRSWPRRIAVAALVLGGVLTHATVSFDVLASARPALCGRVRGWTGTERVGRDLWLCAAYGDSFFMDRPSVPTREDWPLDALEARLLPERERLGRPLVAVFLDELYGLYFRVFQRDLLRKDLFRHQDLLLLTRCWDAPWMVSVFEDLRNVEATIAAADVVLIRWGAREDEGGKEDEALRGRRCKVFWPQERDWVLGGSLPMEDGTELRFYLRAGR
jgi:hypothetical protein